MVAAASSAGGATRLTSPAARASCAEIGSPVSSISIAFFWPMARLKATIGVEQNSPIFTPGRGEARVVGGHRQIAAGHQLATRRGGDAMHLGDHRLRDGLDGQHHLGADVEQLPIERGFPADHLAEIVAGAEGWAVAAQDHHRGLALPPDHCEAVDKLPQVLLRERIAPGGPVHGDDSHRACLLDMDIAVDPRLEHTAAPFLCASSGLTARELHACQSAATGRPRPAGDATATRVMCTA